MILFENNTTFQHPQVKLCIYIHICVCVILFNKKRITNNTQKHITATKNNQIFEIVRIPILISSEERKKHNEQNHIGAY